jgi:L,D-peptidoglycan transpeptidase YkuD (ErfK/YbiS/YcfS/YnhG family)
MKPRSFPPKRESGSLAEHWVSIFAGTSGVLLLLLSSSLAHAQSCPEPLASARRLVLVTAPTMNSATASIERFDRHTPNSEWQVAGGATSGLIGHKGVGWAQVFRKFARPGEPIKVEGDKRAPAGFFKIGPSFGFGPSQTPNYVRIDASMVCVDDVSSAAYNTITRRERIGPAVRAENMSRIPDYRRGLLVDYPTDRKARAGSCVFIHLALPGRTGTGGCVALSEPQLEAVQDFAQDGAVLAILPRQALARFKGCLPSSQ